MSNLCRRTVGALCFDSSLRTESHSLVTIVTILTSCQILMRKRDGAGSSTVSIAAAAAAILLYIFPLGSRDGGRQ